MTFKVDGTTRITLAAIPAAFGTAANNVYYGSSFNGTLQGEATIDLNTTAVELRSFTAKGGDGAVALFWETASELDNLGFRSPSRLKSERNRADYLLIAPREFLRCGGAATRASPPSGVAARSVAVEDLFTEFGYGEARPEAILEFLSYAHHHWRPPAPRYVLLLGDATYDFKGLPANGHFESRAPVHGEDPIPPDRVRSEIPPPE